MSGPDVRLDVALNRLCLTRSRNEAKQACEAGAVLVDGRPAKASQALASGARVTLRFTHRHLDVRILKVPERSVSKKNAREMYEVLSDERVER